MRQDGVAGRSILERVVQKSGRFAADTQISTFPLKKSGGWMTDKNTKPPKDLGAAGRRFWLRVVDEGDVDLEPFHLDVLEQAARSLDRAEACRKQVDAEGLTIKDRFDQTKSHPLLSAERDARSAFRQLYRELGLDFEDTGPMGRPTGR